MHRFRLVPFPLSTIFCLNYWLSLASEIKINMRVYKYACSHPVTSLMELALSLIFFTFKLSVLDTTIKIAMNYF